MSGPIEVAENEGSEERRELRLYLVIETALAAIGLLPSLTLPYLVHSDGRVLTFAWTAVPYVLLGSIVVGWMAFSAESDRLTRAALLLPILWIGGLVLVS